MFEDTPVLQISSLNPQPISVFFLFMSACMSSRLTSYCPSASDRGHMGLIYVRCKAVRFRQLTSRGVGGRVEESVTHQETHRRSPAIKNQEQH